MAADAPENFSSPVGFDAANMMTPREQIFHPLRDQRPPDSFVMKTQEVVTFSDQSTLTIPTSVLKKMTGIKDLQDQTGIKDLQDQTEGKIVLNDSINPELFTQLITYLTSEKTSQEIIALDFFQPNQAFFQPYQELFQAEPNISMDEIRYSLVKNIPILSLLGSLGVDSLQEEIKTFGQGVNLNMTFSCQELCQLATIPETIWTTLYEGRKFYESKQLSVDFSDNTADFSDRVDASIKALEASGITVVQEVNSDASSSGLPTGSMKFSKLYELTKGVHNSQLLTNAQIKKKRNIVS
ncbi:MAG: hypothetical protein COY39_06025 [Alphaproteobacteria bacterium CG_4_10_14_0_8_um_filter_37_21]|nr:MAG: hypothetical protein COY39_06025 [Alphaproteobacteria bacterium CG_4_10_14_0_8_um_filter_37_21]